MSFTVNVELSNCGIGISISSLRLSIVLTLAITVSLSTIDGEDYRESSLVVSTDKVSESERRL